MATIRERIDRAMGNISLREGFPNLEIFHIDPQGSDHHILLVNFCYTKSKKVREFKFEARWAKHEKFNQIVRKWWYINELNDLSSLLNFLTRLISCKKELARWSRKEFPNSKKIIAQLSLELADCLQNTINSDSKRNAEHIKIALEAVYDQEEEYWWQRSQIQWLQSGDKNSSFFHLSTLKRRSINSILRLKNDDNRWLMEQDDINANISGFYRNLFCSSGERRMEEVLNYINPRITPKMNQSLMLPITRNEIR